MQYPTRDLRAGLRRKGFEITNDGDHYWAFLTLRNGLVTKIKSKVGGHSLQKYKDLNDFWLGTIKGKLHFGSVSQLIEYSECPFSQREYETMLARNGHIQLPPRGKIKRRKSRLR